MKLRLIPPGKFDMGATPEEIEPNFKEEPSYKEHEHYRKIVESALPRHEVRLTRPYLAGTHEVTWAQFKEFVDATGHRTDAEKNGGGQVWDKKTKAHVRSGLV